MDVLQSILMGFVQGLSEFLPISSSAHLVFTSSLYKLLFGGQIDIESGEEIFLSIMLHVGTLFAILVFFRREIGNILRATMLAVRTKSFESDDAKVGLNIIIATVFTVLVAYPLKDVSELLVFSPNIVGMLLVITGVYLLLSERYKTEREGRVSLLNAIYMGIAQGLAAFPGFSRSGLTIATGLFGGVDRNTCARFSFLLSVPIILGASVLYPLLELDVEDIVGYNWVAIILGTLTAFVVGYYCIKYFLKFIARFSLRFFAYYCIAVGVFFGILFSIKQIY